MSGPDDAPDPATNDLRPIDHRRDIPRGFRPSPEHEGQTSEPRIEGVHTDPATGRLREAP